jgi:ABC-type uncharacterized transport system ATPase subunit
MRIELIDIHKHFGPVRANDGITMTIEGGVIYGLLGENGAGKTTLMKILSGFQSPDSGQIRVDGQEISFDSPAAALRHGIGMLYQDPLDFGPFRVLDNFLMGYGQTLFPPRRQARQELLKLAGRFDFGLDPDAQVQMLTVGERQQLEILRLLSRGVQVLILDEPTTGISAPQKIKLFATLRRLAREENKSVIFVSHKLEEVQDLCDQVTVLRQGQVSGRVQAPFDTAQLVALMFDECSIAPARAPLPAQGQETRTPVLELDDVSIHTYRLRLSGLSLRVYPGEVIGIAGLEGSGQRIMLQACAGLITPTAGRILIDGVEQSDHLRWMMRRPYHRLMRAGMAYVPADRMGEGLVRGLDLTEHMILSDPGAPFFIDWEAARQRTLSCIDEYHIKGRPDSTVESLSGGNQQRALQALLRPTLRLLLMEHPTRGLDIESAAWIWERLLRRRAQGTALLFISADLDEIVEYSDRVVVFSGGQTSDVLDTRSTSCEQLGYLIGGMSMSSPQAEEHENQSL